MKARVLVTGGAGFIGSHTVDLLLHKGYEVRILDSLAAPVHVNGQKPSYVPANAEFIQGDVRDRQVIDQALRGVDAVFHLAAYQDYLPDFATFFDVNSVSTALLYELVVARGYPIQKVVLASSQSVYGEGKYECPTDSKQYPPLRPLDLLRQGTWEPRCPLCGCEMTPVPTDETVVNPHNQYAISKYTQEMIALNLGKRYNIPTVCLRYSITQGARQSFYNAYSGILRTFTMRLLNDAPPIIYEDGQQLRDYVCVGDVAQANLLALEDDRANYQVFNVGGGRATTVLEYAYLVAEKLGKAISPCIPGEFRFGDTRHIISDISKLQTLGWEPTAMPEQIIEEYIAWAQEQPDVKDYYAEAEQVMRKVGTIQVAHLEGRLVR
jgi:dTDP-L-rhamnose 4-epimerase